MALSDNIKRLRMEHGLSQEQFAETVDVTRQSVSKWETGKANPDMDKLILIANLFQISLSDLTETNEVNTDHAQDMKRTTYEADKLLLEHNIKRLKQKLNIWRIVSITLSTFIICFAIAGYLIMRHYYPGVLNKIFGEQEDEDCIYAVLEHNNLYQDGIDGLLGDLENAVDLPQYLKLENSFVLHFTPDGTITSIETMWCGYDERYCYVDSYLITYDAGKSDKMSIYLGGGTGDAYNEEKDLNILFDALRLIPFEKTVQDFNQPEYGILYIGYRSWGYNAEGIRYLDRSGNIDIPSNEVSEEFYGPTISVYCTQDDTITPVRYLFCEDNTKEMNVN